VVKAGSVELSISDHGPGVPEDQLPRIFDPFYRVQKGREMQSGGIGLGLTIAHRAVRLHGGKIAPRNRPQGGLEMAISLPQVT
jgi:two-component system, OmpR family, sensor histidine kinase CpxA